MKNFFKKLSFVLAIAMVLTSIAPAATVSAKEVVPAKKINVKVDGEKVTSVELGVEETKTVKLGLVVKKAYAGQKSTYKTWAVAADETVVDVVKEGNRTYTLTGVAAGETTIAIRAAKTLKLAKAGKGVKAELNVVVEASQGISNLDATHVNELEVTFANAVDTEDVTLAVTKGASKVAHEVKWNADKTVATITTTAKLTKGTYTVTATSAKDAEFTAEASVDVENQHVDEIIILNDVALTGKANIDADADLEDAGVAYVYYKVVDQYGDDLTASTSIDWNTSSGKPTVKRNEGKLIVSRSDDKSFTFGEQLYVTGVHKSGKNVNATLTIGAAQALDQIEMVGFVKKNTNTILETLPTGFKSGEYYLLYLAVDKNGNALEVTGSHTTSDVTFVSNNVLLVRELDHADYPVVVNGVSYFAATVVPGQYVTRGGEVTIQAIAATGTSTYHNYAVGQNQILTSFTMSDPTTLVADGEKVEIPFTALDQNGEVITNFVTLADNLNRLTFNVSVGTVTLAEQKDGTAKLVFADEEMDWDDSQSTDGIDRKVSITSVVVGGDSDNLMLDICDKARPDAIKEVAVSAVYLEGADNNNVELKHFLFLDQYGRVIGKEAYLGEKVQDNGFFSATELHGIEFEDYTFGIVMEFKGSGNALATSGAISADNKSAVITGGAVSFDVAAKTQTALSGNVFTFTIAKKHEDKTEWENISTTVNKGFTVVDIAQVKGFMIAPMKKQMIITDASEDITGKDFGLTPTVTAGTKDITDCITVGDASVDVDAVIPRTHRQAITVLGFYNGETVFVPSKYYKAEGTKLELVEVNVLVDDYTNAELLEMYGKQAVVDYLTYVAPYNAYQIKGVSTAAIKWSDLYDATHPNYLRKDTSDVIKATIYEIYDVDGNRVAQTKVRDTASTTVAVADAMPTLAKINTLDEYDITPVLTTTTSGAIMAVVNYYNSLVPQDLYVDQYGVAIEPTRVTYKISQVVENVGYAENNFMVTGNDSAAVYVDGAERLDTFVFTITASYGNVTLTKDIKITIVADKYAAMDNDANYYTNGIDKVADDLKDWLETQRLDGLK